MKNLLACLLIIISICSFGQSIERAVIGSTGNFTQSSTIQISSTVGEVAVLTREAGSIFLTEGFQQPIIRHIEEVNFKVYTGFSPNGDGINDTWIIDGIEQYPDNEVLIFGRWGEELWKGVGYNNTSVVFEGNNKRGVKIPEGTYVYIITLTNGPKLDAGWVQISR
jgi:gliding motility-associated-like protein